MNDMLTLSEPHEYDAVVDGISEDEYNKESYRKDKCPEIGTRRQPEYSNELLKLVSECLRIDREHRPKPAALVTRVEAGKARYEDGVETDLNQNGLEIGDDKETLHFRRNDINNLRDTTDDADFPYLPLDWQRVVLSRYQGPS
jgi:hypothetical protein